VFRDDEEEVAFFDDAEAARVNSELPETDTSPRR
jgi:hypothetical protein